jgi:MFS family permease
MMGAGASQRRGWYHGWNIVAVCVLASAVGNGLPVNAFSLFLNDWSVQLHAPISFFQLGLAALGLFSAVFSPFVGALADKHSARWLIVGGLLGIALFYLGVSFVTASWQLLALYMLLLPVSIAFSATLTANAVVSRWFVRRLGLALGLTSFGLGLAGVILPPIVAAVMPEFGWRTVWRFGGIFVAVIVVPLVLLIVRDRPTERDGLRYLTLDGAAPAVRAHGHSQGGVSDGLTWRDVLARRNFWLLVAVYLPMLGLNGGCANNLAPIAAVRGLSTQTAGILLSAFSLAYVGATLIAGMLSDRFGNRVPLFGLAMATTVGGLMVAFGHGVAALGVGVTLVGLSGGMWPLLAAAVATEFGASGVGRAFGLLMMFLPVIVLSPFIVAKVHETTGSYVPALVGLAILTFLGGVACLLFMRERRGGRGTDAGQGVPAELKAVAMQDG